eukprot:scaffold29883_cov153-Skeletonema_marinoi.AAC.1
MGGSNCTCSTNTHKRGHSHLIALRHRSRSRLSASYIPTICGVGTKSKKSAPKRKVEVPTSPTSKKRKSSDKRILKDLWTGMLLAVRSSGPDDDESCSDCSYHPGTGQWKLRIRKGELRGAYFHPSPPPQVELAVSVAFEAGTFDGKAFDAGFYDGEIVAFNEGVHPGTFKIVVAFEDGSYEECNYPSVDIKMS